MTEQVPEFISADAVYEKLSAIEERLNTLVESHNQVGANIAWIVANTQGLFQMFNNPDMMNQMMGMIGGGVFGGGRADAAKSS